MSNATATKQYFVLATSGWQGDRWELDSIHDTKAEAETRREAIRSTDAKAKGYITTIIATSRDEWPGDEDVVILDTSRISVREPHLKARRCRVNAERFVRGE